jgi:hypothetical protein
MAIVIERYQGMFCERMRGDERRKDEITAKQGENSTARHPVDRGGWQWTAAADGRGSAKTEATGGCMRSCGRDQQLAICLYCRCWRCMPMFGPAVDSRSDEDILGYYHLFTCSLHRCPFVVIFVVITEAVHINGRLSHEGFGYSWVWGRTVGVLNVLSLHDDSILQ